MSSNEDRDKSRREYEQKRIREKMLIRAELDRQDAQSAQMRNLGSNNNSNDNNVSSSNSTNDTFKLASQLSNLTTGINNNNSSASVSSSTSRFSDVSTILGDTVFQGFQDPSAVFRPKATNSISSSSSSDTQVQVLDPYQRKMREFELIQEKRRQLPVYAKKQEFLQAVAENQVIVLQSDTGSGKSTQLPTYLLEAGYKKVVVTQPRVLAATSVAERVADELGVVCGSKVGYKVRFESRVTDRTELAFVTDGMLLKECMTDPDLSEYMAVMIDEAHERSVNTDLLLGLIRDLIRRRSDLRIIIASATMVGQRFIDFFGEKICKKFEIPGRTFPVKGFFVPEAPEDHVKAACDAVFEIHLNKPIPGDILVFLTGQDDIERCELQLREMMNSSAVREPIILPLYSALPMDKQRKIYEPAPHGTRKVILATNVAETSITIDGIVYVVDCGLCKQKYYDTETGTEALSVVPISKAAAAQRKGRAGRTQPGECVRLYTKQMFQLELVSDPAPEILRCSLTSVILTLKALGVHDFTKFDFVDPPSPDAIGEALKTLLLLGAVTSSGGRLTKTGRFMAELPLEPPLAKMLLHAQNELGCGKQAAIVVAILSLQNSIFYIPKDKRNAADSALRRFFRDTCGDVTGYCQVFTAWESEGCSRQWANAHFLNSISGMRAREIRNQLVNTVVTLSELETLSSNLGGIGPNEHSLTKLDDCLTKSFLAGFFMNTSTLSADMVSYSIIKSPKITDAVIHPASCFFQVMSKKLKQSQEAFDQKTLMARLGGDQEEGTKFRFCDPDTGKPPMICFAELRSTPRSFLNHIAAVREDWVRDVAPAGYFSKSQLSGNSGAQSMMAAAVANDDEKMLERRRPREQGPY